MTAREIDLLAQALAFVLGAVVGSFLNVVIVRVPEGRSVVRPGSACGACGAPVRWYDNVPILAWLWLRARCRDCGARLSPRYPLVEAGTALLALAAFRAFGPTLEFVIAFAFLAALVAASGVDLRIREIPDAVTLPGMLIALALAPWSRLVPTPLDALVGCLGGMGGLFLVASVYEWVRDREGMGLGDVKLLGLVGAVLGWQALLPTVLLAALTGAVAGLAAMLAAGKRDLAFAVPFGPFLAAGAALSLLLPEWLPSLLARLTG
jgi:leader peptidase (prepilin peptidase) / N-methyltransferase